MGGERKFIIDLPLKLVLTDEGTTFFIRNNKKINKFKLADNKEEYGLFLDKFSPASIQRMFMIDYISKIEISKSEFMSSRQEIMDLSKLIVYGILYRQYDIYIFNRILNSDLIKKWNRLNPASIIDEKTKINNEFLQNVLQSKHAEISDIKQQILAPLYNHISKNANLLPEEKNIQLLLSEKFLNNLRPFIWFVITKFKGADGYDQVIKDIRTSLMEYMDKSKIAEYVSLMTMELAINAENTNLKREAKAMFKGTIDINAVLFDPNIRKQVSDALERKGELVYLSWQLGSRSNSIGTQGKLQITLYNKESEYRAMKASIDDKKSADLKRKTLMDFYKDVPEDEANSELGLYYLSYLSEACEKVNVKFESLVNQIKDSDLTVITLVLNF